MLYRLQPKGERLFQTFPFCTLVEGWVTMRGSSPHIIEIRMQIHYKKMTFVSPVPFLEHFWFMSLHSLKTRSSARTRRV